MNRKIRIAFVNISLSAGGGTVFLLNFGGDLVQRGIHVHVFGLDEVHPLASDFEAARIPVSLENPSRMIFEDRVRKALKQLSSFCPNVVIFNVEALTAEIARHCPPHIVLIGVIHSFSQIEALTQYAGVFHGIVGVSDHLGNVLKDEPALKDAPVTAIQMGVPVFPPNGRDVLSGEPLRILYLGRLDETSKRVRLFPEILRGLTDSGIPFAWTIAGEGPERLFLEKSLVTKRPHQTVHFSGAVARARVPALLAAHDILLLCSDSETFSFSLHEAMGAGLVPVASDLSGPVGDVVRPNAGILVSPSRVQGYAEAIVWLHHHRASMQRMAECARERILRVHSIERMTDQWLEYLSGMPIQGSIFWPEDFEISTPLFAGGAWRFSRWGRAVRRAGAGVRDLFGRSPL